jgi:hypothetical protein
VSNAFCRLCYRLRAALLCCHYFTLNVSAYMAIFKCVGYFYFHIPAGICFSAFLSFLARGYTLQFPFEFFCSVFLVSTNVGCSEQCLVVSECCCEGHLVGVPVFGKRQRRQRWCSCQHSLHFGSVSHGRMPCLRWHEACRGRNYSLFRSKYYYQQWVGHTGAYKSALSNAAPAIYFSGALRKHII